MNKSKILIKKLRRQIPKMQCVKGCSNCCGPVIFSKWEWSQIKNKKKADSIKCPYSSPNGCEIYENRPILCRLFGIVKNKKMICPKGCRPLKYLSSKKEIEIMTAYVKLIRSEQKETINV